MNIKPWFNIGGLVASIWGGLISAAPVKIWAQIGAGVTLTLVFVGFGLVIWLGPWLPSYQGQQIAWLGYGMLSAAVLVLVALVAITGLSVDLHGSKEGLHARIDQDDQPPSVTIDTHTKTVVTPTDATATVEVVEGEPPRSDPLEPK